MDTTPVVQASSISLHIIIIIFSSFQGSEIIEGISLDMSQVKEIRFNPSTFTKMPRLRFFKFYNSISRENRCKVHHSRCLKSLSNELRYFRWDGYPLKSLPSKNFPEHLVSLQMPYSNIEQLWNGVQVYLEYLYENLSIPNFKCDGC